MLFELRTSLRWSKQRPSDRWERSRSPRGSARLVLAFSALLALTAGCDGDDTSATSGTGGSGGGGGEAGSGTSVDGARDGADDRSAAGAGGASSDAGHEETGHAGDADPDHDPTSSDGRSDTEDDDEDASDDVTSDVPDDTGAGDVAVDADDDSSDDAPFDSANDAPRDTGPIVIGPPHWRSARFAVIGDYGVATTDEGRVANLVHSWDVDFVITTGDNDYTAHLDGIDGVIGRYYSDFIGNYWGAYGPGSRTTRFWPSPGNHDWDIATLSAYIDYFTLPGNERYYEVNLGLVHLFAVDSDPREPDGTSADSIQGQWLRSALARSSSCFNVVYFHHAAYSSAHHGSYLQMRWPFEAWGADVVLAGHDHVYERFEVGEIPYFTVGLGGAAPYAFVTTLPETRAQFNSDFGAMLVTANRRGMRFEFIDANGTVVDTLQTRKRCR